MSWKCSNDWKKAGDTYNASYKDMEWAQNRHENCVNIYKAAALESHSNLHQILCWGREICFKNWISSFLVKNNWHAILCFRCMTQWFDINIHYNMVITVSLVTICQHAKLWRYDWQYSLCYTSIFIYRCPIYFITRRLHLLILFIYFCPPPKPLPLWQPSVFFSLSVSLFLFCLVF